LGQLDHRDQVVLDHGLRRRTRVARDVIRSREDHDDGRLKRDHVLPKAHEHLRRGLSADTSAHVRFAREHHIEIPRPRVRDGVSVEHHPALARPRRAQLRVRLAVPGEERPILTEPRVLARKR